MRTRGLEWALLGGVTFVVLLWLVLNTDIAQVLDGLNPRLDVGALVEPGGVAP